MVKSSKWTFKKNEVKMFVLPSRTSKMIKSHEVSNKNFKNHTADNVLKIRSSQNDYPGSSSVKKNDLVSLRTLNERSFIWGDFKAHQEGPVYFEWDFACKDCFNSLNRLLLLPSMTLTLFGTGTYFSKSNKTHNEFSVPLTYWL